MSSNAMPTSNAPPQVAGLRLGGVVGRGATSTVWAAVRDEDGSPVAVKVIAPERYHVGALMELAARESAILDLVHHDHIVRMHEVHPLADGSVAVVLDLADGGTLADLLTARGRLTPGETATICTPVASALAALHHAGVIHGDVSPHNVLFTRDGRPMLADFEAARLVGESHPPVVAGTPGFLAPEILTGGLPTAAGDVYAVGALAWFALTGRALGAVNAGAAATGSVPAPTLDEARGLVGVEFAPVVVELLADDPAARPSADEAAIRCYEAATAEPVQLMPVAMTADPAVALTQRLRNPGACDPQQRASTPAPASPPLPPGSPSGYAVAPSAPTLPPLGAPGPGSGGHPPAPAAAAPTTPTGPVTGAPRSPTTAVAAPSRAAARAETGQGLPGADSGPGGYLGPPGDRQRRRRSARTATPGSPTGRAGSRAAGRSPARALPARPWVRVVTLLVLGALTTVGLVVLLANRRAGTANAGPVPTPTTTTSVSSTAPSGSDPLQVNPAAVVGQLAAARAEALMSGDPTQLGKADAPDSALYRADTAILDSLRRSGQRYTGLAFIVRSAEWVSGDATTARVLAVVDRSAYDVVGPSGERRGVPAEPGRPLVYSLVRTTDGWRIVDVQA